MNPFPSHRSSSARSQFLISIFVLILSSARHVHSLGLKVPSHSTSFWYAKRELAIIKGTVVCQDCRRMITAVGSAHKLNAVQGAVVSVSCTNSYGKALSYAVAKTNKYGIFSIQLKDFYTVKHGLKNCKVKLVSSPLKNCNVKTNLNDGIIGATAIFKKTIFKNSFYVVGPFSFKPFYCQSPPPLHPRRPPPRNKPPTRKNPPPPKIHVHPLPPHHMPPKPHQSPPPHKYPHH